MTRYISLQGFDREAVTAIETIWECNKGRMSENMRGFAMRSLLDRGLGFPIKEPTANDKAGMEALCTFLDKCATGELAPPAGVLTNLKDWMTGEIKRNQKLLEGVEFLKATFTVKKSWIKRTLGKGHDIPTITVPVESDLRAGRSKLIARKHGNNQANQYQLLPVPEPVAYGQTSFFESEVNGNKIGIEKSRQNNNDVYDVVELNAAGDHRKLLSGASRAELNAVNLLVGGHWHDVPIMQANIQSHAGVATNAQVQPIAGIYESPGQPLDETPDAQGDTPAEQIAREQQEELMREVQARNNNLKGF